MPICFNFISVIHKYIIIQPPNTVQCSLSIKHLTRDITALCMKLKCNSSGPRITEIQYYFISIAIPSTLTSIAVVTC